MSHDSPVVVNMLVKNFESHWKTCVVTYIPTLACLQKGRKFQEFFNLEKNKILKVSQTRWLSMKGAVKRILEQYSALKLYFTSDVMEDATHTNESILKSLNNKFIQAYLEFMDYSLGRFALFNILFQSETPLLHRLKDEVERLILSICGDILKMSVSLTNSIPRGP
jgi:hypothetical protein